MADEDIAKRAKENGTTRAVASMEKASELEGEYIIAVGNAPTALIKLKELIEEKGLKCTVELEKDPHGDSIGLKKSGCHGFCEMGPLVRIEPEGICIQK